MMTRLSRSSILCALALWLLALPFISVKTGEAEASPRIVQLQKFSVMGFETRTTNAKEMTKEGQIGGLWARIQRENLLDKIPNKLDHNIVVVYSNYESDKDGAYSYLIGAKTADGTPALQGMVVRDVSSGRFAIFTSEKGPAAKVVPEVWQRIWTVSKSDLGGQRAYKSDFEIYDQRAADPQNSQVDVYVGIK
jgi:predicted transcriptional regulator YdeE